MIRVAVGRARALAVVLVYLVGSFLVGLELAAGLPWIGLPAPSQPWYLALIVAMAVAVEFVRVVGGALGGAEARWRAEERARARQALDALQRDLTRGAWMRRGGDDVLRVLLLRFHPDRHPDPIDPTELTQALLDLRDGSVAS